ncbi:hypothetical protein PoB_002243900 [Plakobranchus ocellatus]|uniref:Uncharacterized protein n=1 Tax=Plakobranchus ocellatus TaxID=259542 RepID=A0AAV3ZPX0_9GAST|nr:hypothetical protein PoB_002243900 [Plakobranchus ocellatus]
MKIKQTSKLGRLQERWAQQVTDNIQSEIEAARERTLENLDMSMMMGMATTRAQDMNLRIRRTKDKLLGNFLCLQMDSDVTRYYTSCEMCHRTVEKGSSSTENAPGIVPLM